MAAVVNERDLLLQGAAERLVDFSLPGNVVVPAARALVLSAPAYTFRVATNGVSDPSGITITAELKNITGTPPMTWSVTAGSATLTGTGYARTVMFDNMTTNFITVRASVVVDGLTYQAETSIVKVFDGVVGVDGRRGSVAVARAIAGSVWSDLEAQAALTAIGAGEPIATDTCTLFNVNTNFSEMRRYDGAAWVLVGESMPGSVLMKGSITTEKLLVTGLGLALNSDPNTQDVSAWTGNGVSIAYDNTAPSGSSALSCTGVGATVLSTPFQIDPTRDYRLRLWGKQQSGTSTTYLAVAFYDASGVLIPGTGNGTGWPAVGTYHYYGRLNQQLPATWTNYSVDFGPNETAKIPEAARSVRVGLLSNFTGSGEHRVTGVLCHLKTSGEMVVDGSITANKIDTRGLSIKDANGNIILAAGTALDWSNVGGLLRPEDGATVGATIGSDLAGEFTAGNIGAYFSSAVITSAHISDLSASKVTSGSISVGQQVSSSSYSSGVSGWIISGDGSAEFNNVTVRGTLAGSSVVGSSVTVGVGGPTLGAVAADAEDALAGLSSKLNSSTSDVLTGVISPVTTGGIRAGSVTWSSSTGTLTGGTGVALTPGGLLGAKAGVATFTITSSGDATFSGDVITGGDAQFSGKKTSTRSVNVSGTNYSVDYSGWADATTSATSSSYVRAGFIGYASATTSAWDVGIIGRAPSTVKGIGVVGDGGAGGGYFSTTNAVADALQAHNVGGGRAIYATGSITSTSNITAYSDRRLKTDLAAIEDALGKVRKLTGYTYVMKATGRRQTGLVAQDVRAVLPEAVEDDGEYLSLAYGNLVGLLVEAIKELDRRTS